MKRKIFITGGTGFLGGHLLSQASPNWQVHATYRKHSFPFAQINWHKIELTDYDELTKLIETIQPDVIIHAAAMANLDQVEINRQLAYENNVTLTEKLAEISALQNIRFIFISSDMVYDGSQGNYVETDPPNPLNYYGRTKLWAEEKVTKICQNFVIARSALIYGCSLTESKSFSEWMVSQWQAEKPTPLFTDQFRSPVLVENLAEALLELAQNNYNGILNLGGAERINRYDFGIVFAKTMSVSINLLLPKLMKAIDFKAIRPMDTSFNISRVNTILKTKILDCTSGTQYLQSHYKL